MFLAALPASRRPYKSLHQFSSLLLYAHAVLVLLDPVWHQFWSYCRVWAANSSSTGTRNLPLACCRLRRHHASTHPVAVSLCLHQFPEALPGANRNFIIEWNDELHRWLAAGGSPITQVRTDYNAKLHVSNSPAS